MSFTVSNNNPREDPIFQAKVKGALLQDAGAGGLVEALIGFRVRNDDAVQRGQPGLSDAEFTQYLKDCGAQLSPFESQYLCRAFGNEDQRGYIDETTFVRHLCGMNQRRMQAVLQLWTRLDKDSDGCVAANTLMATHREAAEEAPVPASTAGFDQTFQSTGAGSYSLKNTRTQGNIGSSGSGGTGPTTSAMSAAAQSTDGGAEGSRRVSFDELLAFYAGLSQNIRKDEDFVVHVLREWASDAPSHPKLNETHREWGADGDPLASKGPLYVSDALNQQLGVSSKSYNYSQMQRVHPPREPLPPLSRSEIMKTTSQERMPAYTKAQMDMADPLVTRRGQPS